MNLVEFPGLGLQMYIKREAIENLFGINNFDIYWYGIIIAVGFLLAVLLGMKNSKLAGIESDSVLDLVLFAAPAAIICARLYYVIFQWDLFKDNLLDIVNTRKGGLAIYGGVLGAILVAYFFAKYKKVKFLSLMDFGVPYLVMAQGIGRWGNFVNQEAFGTATSLPWRMNGSVVNSELSALNPGIDLSVYGAHPTFLYESLWDFAVFFFLIWFRKKKKLDGEVFFLYMLLYGVGRFFIESLRTDSLMVGSFRISQLLAALFAVAFTALFIYRRKKVNQSDEEAPVEIGQSEYGNVLMKLREEENASEEAQGQGREAAGADGEDESDAETDAGPVSDPDETEETGAEPESQPDVGEEDGSREGSTEGSTEESTESSAPEENPEETPDSGSDEKM